MWPLSWPPRLARGPAARAIRGSWKPRMGLRCCSCYPPPSQNVFAVPKISSLEPSAQPATGTGAFPAQDLGVGYTCGHDRSPPFSVKSFLFAGRLAKRFDHDLLRLITKIFLVPMTPPSRCISEGGVHCLGDLIRFFRPNRFTFDHLMNLGFSWFFVVDNLHPFTNSSCSSFTIKECP